MPGAYAYTPAIWLPLVVAVFLVATGFYAWRHRDVPGGKPFLAISAITVPIVLSIALEAAAVAPETRLAHQKLQFILMFAGVIPVACMVLDYAFPGRWLTRRNLVLLSVPFLICLVLVVIDDSRLMWRAPEANASGELVLHFAPAGAIVAAYGVAMFLFNAAVFIYVFIRSPQHRWPVAMMLAGDLAGRVMYALYVLDAAPAPALTLLDAFVVGHLLCWGMYAIALFGFRIFDPLPAAHATAVAQMPEGMVVFNTQWRVASLNPAAASMLSMPAARTRGRLLAEILPAQGAEATRCVDPDSMPMEISIESGGELHQYALDFTALEDFRGLVIGHLLMLHDVTRQRQVQAQVLEQQRRLAVIRERERLARELHDNLGQVLAFVTTQGQAIHRLLSRGEIAEADAQVGRLVDVASEADTDLRESILGLRAAFDAQGLLPALAAYLSQYEKRYGIHTTLSAPQALGDGALDPLAEVQLLRIIQEALTNARKHARARAVWVTFVVDDGHAQVTVQDDGCGFDQQAVSGDPGNRVGLRVMHERAEEADGALAVQSAVGEGTRVIVTVPLRAASR